MRTIVVLLAFAGAASGAEPPPVKAPPRVKGFVAPALPTDPNTPAPPGMRWIKYGDGPWKLEKLAPAVALPKGGTFLDRSHTCARCGREQRTVDRFNADGTHSHVCDACGHAWKH